MKTKLILLAGIVGGVASVAQAQTATAEADVSLGKISNQYICTFDSSVSRANVSSETGKADAGIASGVRTAFALYEERADAAGLACARWRPMLGSTWRSPRAPARARGSGS